MKRLGKILLFLIAIIGLAFSICLLSLFHNIPYITYLIREYQDFYPWWNPVFFIFAVILCFGFFMLLVISLFLPGNSSEITLIKEKGRLQFSKQTIESTVRYSYVNVEGINSSKVRVRLSGRPEKTRIYVKLSLSDSSKLVELTENIQDKIESALKTSLDITVKSIHIKVVEFNPDKKVQKEYYDEAANDSRVI